ncbi:hypothetical protein LTR05_008004 [Lithohypha guttulata]|uniref:Uncharacterized protein n=1 Tax=Lithohypha guttulata TaxID=1690604 RepID=A0AAN7Y3S1_9EURO|nr:hypothetical protein LTR05_008004 [Lithohypha guttulata]
MHSCRYFDLGCLITAGAAFQFLAQTLRSWLPLFAVTFFVQSFGMVKGQSLDTPPELASDRLDLLAVEESVQASSEKLTVQANTTLSLVVESIFALSVSFQFPLARPREEQSLDIPTVLREKNVCVNSAHQIAHHSTAFTWRSNNDEEVEHDENKPTRPIVTGVKGEAAAFQAFAMCYLNANRKGRDGVTIATGSHQKWLDNQRQRGSKVELIDICMAALKFFGDRAADLHGLLFRTLQQAVLPS